MDSLNEIYNVTFTKDLNYAITLRPNKVLFLYEICHDNTYNYFTNKNIEVSILNTEPLNLELRLNNIIYYLKKYPGIKLYDYSASNIKILNNNGYTNTEQLNYQIYEEETNLLKKLNECTQKVYDFGIILCEYPTTVKRRQDIVNFLIENNYSIKIIQGWKNIRDEQIASCNVLLNIHGSMMSEVSNIFEHIRCDRLLAAGYKILSESSLFLDENFINQNKNNLKIVEYNKFLNKDLYNNLDWLNLKSFYTKSNKKTFCVIHSCTLQMTGTSVLDYIVEVINKTGFINIVDNVFINNIGLPIENKYQNNKYIVTNYSDNTELFEYPTLNKVGTIATNNPDSNILYLHTKGISHINNINYIADWTNMMLYFLVEKHTECINKLNEGYDAVGCNYIECNQYTDKKHFSGNFWWSKSTYINKLHLLDENTGNRAYAEFWLFTNNPSYYNMHSSNIDHYYNPYSIETYSQNSIIQQIISK